MADSNSSPVSIVAIVAILILVGLAVYVLFIRGGGSSTTELKINVDTIGLVQPAGDMSVARITVPALGLDPVVTSA